MTDSTRSWKLSKFFEGLFGSDQSLITLLNSSKRLIRVQTNEISKEHFLYWSYFWDSDGIRGLYCVA